MNDTLTNHQSQEKDVILWEEKNSTELEKSCLNNNVPEANDTTIIIGKEYPLSEWKNIINQKISGIYKIINKLNGKYYVGSAKNVRQRWYRHVWKLNKGTHHNKHLQNVWRKYNPDIFRFVIVEYSIPNNKTLLLIEQRFLDIAKSERDMVYNIAFIARGNPGYAGRRHSPETIAKMKKSAKNRPIRKHSEITKIRIGLKSVGRFYSSRTRLKMSQSAKNRPEISYTTRQKLKQPKDKTIHSFINTKTGEMFSGFKHHFIMKYGLNRTSVYQVINKKYKKVGDWTLI